MCAERERDETIMGFVAVSTQKISRNITLVARLTLLFVCAAIWWTHKEKISLYDSFTIDSRDATVYLQRSWISRRGGALMDVENWRALFITSIPSTFGACDVDCERQHHLHLETLKLSAMRVNSHSQNSLLERHSFKISILCSVKPF